MSPQSARRRTNSSGSLALNRFFARSAVVWRLFMGRQSDDSVTDSVEPDMNLTGAGSMSGGDCLPAQESAYLGLEVAAVTTDCA
jgi:hypothetical protein